MHCIRLTVFPIGLTVNLFASLCTICTYDDIMWMDMNMAYLIFTDINMNIYI